MIARDDSGSTLPLAIFFGVLCLLLVLIVTAATSLYIERKRLFTTADAAALVGAEAFELSDLKPAPDGSVSPRLRPHNVESAVAEYLEHGDAHEFEGLRVTEATTHDGESASVTLSAQWRPPVVVLFVPEGIRLEASSVSRAVFR